MRFFKILALALLLVGQAHSLSAHEDGGQDSNFEFKSRWIHSLQPLEQYDLTLTPDARFHVECLARRMVTPRDGGLPVCNMRDALDVMNVMIRVENMACYALNTGAPNLCESQVDTAAWTARYAPDDISWQVKNTEFFLAMLMRLAKGAFIGKHLHVQGKNFLAHSVRLPTACSVPDATIVHYDVVTTGVVNGNTVSHTIHTLQGFFAMEVPYVVEINGRSVEVVRELYFSVSVFNGGVSDELGKEACEIIKNLASQARRN